MQAANKNKPRPKFKSVYVNMDSKRYLNMILEIDGMEPWSSAYLRRNGVYVFKNTKCNLTRVLLVVDTIFVGLRGQTKLLIFDLHACVHVCLVSTTLQTKSEITYTLSYPLDPNDVVENY
ncbi:hypothetical protein KP509_18G036400 [Ceratopteris richardii]|uniref:Uncharacterized protein n=1 Tax=Ceratopteris richardii TaxID=49495 RepID=A0A8T2STA8_CERRI|nr:hypothetical protein KP509_18G036400 [Ceratopteris richardii]